MLLSIQNLTVKVESHVASQKLVNNINLSIDSKKIVALVGGSGSGKTTTGLAIMNLLAPELQISNGRIFFEGQDLLGLSSQEMRYLRGKEIGMVFQEPLNAFNPVFRIGYQINEVLRFHTDLTRRQRKERILDLLNRVGLDDPDRVSRNFPHQLSGGMRQRAMIAQAIAADPKLIIADEPTSNLDVTLQARIIELFQKLRDQLNLSILLITHDLGVVRHMSDEVAVMTRGRIVEFGNTDEVLAEPGHEYTQELMNALDV